jgi:beta-lactamase regulating signal transducer with metallopeptidase domain
MSAFILSSWELFLGSLAPLIALALGLSLAGWLFVLCRVAVRQRIAASAFTLCLLMLGSGLVVLAPFMTMRVASVPWVAEVFEAAGDVSDNVVWQPSLPKVVSRHVEHSAESISLSMRDLVGMAWVLGIMWSFGWLFRDGWRLYRHLRALRPATLPSISLPRGTVVLADPGASSPYSCGLWRQVLVLPESWLNEVPDSLSVAVEHERAHLRHRDAITQFAWRVGKALWWWNPFVHLLANRVDELLEWRADAEATRGDAEQAARLSRTLVEIVSSDCTPRLAHAMAASSATLLRRRLIQLLGDQSQGAVSSWAHRCAACVLVIGALGVLAGCSLPLLGTKHDEPYPHGQTIHSTPDHWEEIKDKLPVYEKPPHHEEKSRTQDGGLDLSATTENFGYDKKAARMGQSLARFGEPSKRMIAVEVKIIESTHPVIAPEPATNGWTSQQMNASDLSSWLRTLMTDPDTKTVSYSHMVTFNGRPVMIRSVVNQPVGSPISDEIVYLPVGTVLLLGVIQRPDGRLHLEPDLTLSKIIGSQRVGGNDYPIISSMVYCMAYEGSGFDLAPGESVVLSVDQGKGKTLVIAITPSVIRANDKNPYGMDLAPAGK